MYERGFAPSHYLVLSIIIGTTVPNILPTNTIRNVLPTQSNSIGPLADNTINIHTISRINEVTLINSNFLFIRFNLGEYTVLFLPAALVPPDSY
jgi:hypothetical protein